MKRVLSIPLLRRYATTPGVAKHTSLDSYIVHCEIHKTDRNTTVYRGTLYEYTVLNALSSLQARMERTGGADDKGVDLRGHWALGTRLLPLVVQCKNLAQKLGPKYLRELCGTSRNEETLRVLANPVGYTPLAMQVFLNSEQPIALLVVDDYESGGTLQQLIWNRAAQHMLTGLDVRQVFSKGDTRLQVTFDNKKLSRKSG